MSSVLIVEQREQAGSDSYNRFEYQVHWIVCHIIGKLQEDAECIVFCEFHDDMAEFSPNNQQYQFFQIKTKEDSSDWTIAEMSKREKKKSGSYKKSFLGFIFYNYLTFGAECSHCHFVSNNDFDKEVLLWQCCRTERRYRMKRNDAEQIGDMIRKFFRLNGLESPLNEYRLVQAWKDVVGPAIAGYTSNLYIKNQILYVHLTSSVLRQELMMGRDLLVRNLNKQVGAQVIVNIIFR